MYFHLTDIVVPVDSRGSYHLLAWLPVDSMGSYHLVAVCPVDSRCSCVHEGVCPVDSRCSCVHDGCLAVGSRAAAYMMGVKAHSMGIGMSLPWELLIVCPASGYTFQTAVVVWVSWRTSLPGFSQCPLCVHCSSLIM